MEEKNGGSVPISFLNPGEVLSQTNIGAGSRVADFGAGSGHFTLEAARRVGETGSVVAVDILTSSLESIEGEAQLRGIRNVSCVHANLEKENSKKISSESFNLVIVKDVLFQNEKKQAIIREARRVLVAGGELLVVEWNDHNRTIGPDTSLRIGEKKLQRLIEEEDFDIKKTLAAGDYHYAFVAEKRGEE